MKHFHALFLLLILLPIQLYTVSSSKKKKISTLHAISTVTGQTYFNGLDKDDKFTDLTGIEQVNIKTNESDPILISKVPDLNLHFDNNLITKLPKKLFQLTNLTMLNFKKNKIKKIRHTVYKCKNLKHLYLEANNLVDLPDSLGRLKELTTVSLQNNPKLGTYQTLFIPDKVTTRFDNLVYGKPNLQELLIRLRTNKDYPPESDYRFLDEKIKDPLKSRKKEWKNPRTSFYDIQLKFVAVLAVEQKRQKE